jgi:hypothetical protein
MPADAVSGGQRPVNHKVPSWITGVRLGIEQIHLVIEWIAVGVFSALKRAGKLDFFERVNGQNL